VYRENENVPEVIVTCNSDSVIRSTYGRTKHALSPWPTQGDAAATTASAPETFMILKKSHALDYMSKIFRLCKFEIGGGVGDVQVLDDPLHHAELGEF
jgi:hypothetical protein